MDRYTRLLFGVTCPYSGEKCDTEIDCLDCLVEKEERRLCEEEQNEKQWLEKQKNITKKK